MSGSIVIGDYLKGVKCIYKYVYTVYFDLIARE